MVIDYCVVRAQVSASKFAHPKVLDSNFVYSGPGCKVLRQLQVVVLYSQLIYGITPIRLVTCFEMRGFVPLDADFPCALRNIWLADFFKFQIISSTRVCSSNAAIIE